MLKVAILGANGFIGSRTVEMLHLGNLVEVRPIVRHLSALARLSRFDLDCRIADAFDESALFSAFQECDAVVHAIAGDYKTILGTLTPVYQAARSAGVKRLIYLSSASVHGQSPLPGTDEKSPLSDRQPLAYNNAKVKAERKLQQLRKTGEVEIVVLRPGIVLGPRSFWLTSFAEAALQNRAYLIEGGKGICNSIYVDNLVHAIFLATTTPDVDGEAFIVGDRELVTWADVYRPIATALGVDFNSIPNITYSSSTSTLEDRIEFVLASKPSLAFLSLFPDLWRQAARAAMTVLFQSSLTEDDSIKRFLLPQNALPVASLEMSLLQQCQYKLPYTKAQQALGYDPIVSFSEACNRSIGWLNFAAFPIQKT